tara:strand:- start:392 stop:1264 length:873 start_codon:yes stop_codon:yes gene_type:complete
MAQSTPLPFLLIQKTFPILEKIAPRLAGKFGKFLFFRPFPTPLRKEEKAILEKAERFQLRIDTRNIEAYSWSTENSYKVAVFMHGWAGRTAQPNHLIEKLVDQGYKVYGFDAPGHGASDGKRTQGFEFAELLAQLQSKIGPVDLLVSHSFGSIACSLALSQGFKTKKYVSISAPVINSDVLVQFAKMINATRITTQGIEDLVLEEYGFPFHSVSIESFAPKMPIIPTLLIHDKNDKKVPWFNSERMYELLPHAEFVSTEGLGHNRIMNDPEVIEKVLEFAKPKTKPRELV